MKTDATTILQVKGNKKTVWKNNCDFLKRFVEKAYNRIADTKVNETVENREETEI